MQNPLLFIKIINHGFNIVLALFLTFIVIFSFMLITSGNEITVSTNNSESNVADAGSDYAIANSFEGMITHAGAALSATMSKITHSIAQAAEVVGDALLTFARFVLHLFVTIIKSIFKVIEIILLAMTRTLSWIFDKVILAPFRVVGSITKVPAISNRISPSLQMDNVAIIDPESAEVQEALTLINNKQKAEITAMYERDTKVVWPVNGRITTKFGVPHYPYQAVHSGIDITDNTAPGVTVVYPFMAGEVEYAGWSNSGLGNYVIIDHGDGITSVYAHLDSINVAAGQEVDTGVGLGKQGTTGVSTGTHLHFEIRINGKATDPLPFLNQ